MKKRIALTMLLVPILFLYTGCTSPTQPVADESLRIAQQQFRTIVDDLATLGKQAALDEAYKEVTGNEGNSEARGNALIKMSDRYEDISWLEVQAERAQGLLRDGREWVQAQRGIFDVLVDDWTRAKEAVDTPEEGAILHNGQPQSNRWSGQ